MTRQRRPFSVEFKAEAASLVVDQGYSMALAAENPGAGSQS